MLKAFTELFFLQNALSKFGSTEKCCCSFAQFWGSNDVHNVSFWIKNVQWNTYYRNFWLEIFDHFLAVFFLFETQFHAIEHNFFYTNVMIMLEFCYIMYDFFAHFRLKHYPQCNSEAVMLFRLLFFVWKLLRLFFLNGF